MVWHYDCPYCGEPIAVDWNRHRDETVCPKCRAPHYPPTPDEDPFAYIVGAKWPPEMERSVIARKGAGCAVPGCFSDYNTLAYRKPLSLGGRICADNLIPVCTKHALEIAEKDYDKWVQELKERQAEGKETSIGPESEIELPPFIPPEEKGISYVQPIAQACEVHLTPQKSKKPAIMVPFMRGRVKRVVFDYDWEIKGKARVKVFLCAWPRGEMPYLDFLGSEDFKGTATEKEHSAEREGKGNTTLTLDLPANPSGRWVAAVVISGDGDFGVKEYVLAGTD
ncbi:MAG: HNH endonuclease signature motif containing protein [candidate division WOR-3 bacterium]